MLDSKLQTCRCTDVLEDLRKYETHLLNAEKKGKGEAEVSNINERIPSHLLLRLLLISIGIVLLE